MLLHTVLALQIIPDVVDESGVFFSPLRSHQVPHHPVPDCLSVSQPGSADVPQVSDCRIKSESTAIIINNHPPTGFSA